jgi:hypothetical protein
MPGKRSGPLFIRRYKRSKRFGVSSNERKIPVKVAPVRMVRRSQLIRSRGYKMIKAHLVRSRIVVREPMPAPPEYTEKRGCKKPCSKNASLFDANNDIEIGTAMHIAGCERSRPAHERNKRHPSKKPAPVEKFPPLLIIEHMLFPFGEYRCIHGINK